MKFSARIFVVMFTTFMSFRESFAGHCREEYPCPKYCSLGEKTYKNCGFAGWGRCTIYKTVSYRCGGTCIKDVCCEGFGGDDCSRPICHGSTYCRNGGTCRAPNMCSCRIGYSSPMCDDIDECLANNGGCDHGFENTLGSYKCTCQHGYMLDVDGKSCIDVDECKDKNGGCSDVCMNTNGSYVCGCGNDGDLHNNQFECIGHKTTPILLCILITAIIVGIMVLLGFRYKVWQRCCEKCNDWKYTLYCTQFKPCLWFRRRSEGILNDSDEGVVYFAEDGNVEVHE